MPDDSVRVIRCLLKGTSTPMKVLLSVDQDIDDLKAMLYDMGKNSVLRDAYMPDLTVWKVRQI